VIKFVFCLALLASFPAMAVPTAKCENADKSITASFWYYKNLRSNSVQVGGVVLNINGTSQMVSGETAEDRAAAELKIGFVLFADGMVMMVGDGAATATVYNADGNTIAELTCGRLR
jgi:hypothetical protein